MFFTHLKKADAFENDGAVQDVAWLRSEPRKSKTSLIDARRRSRRSWRRHPHYRREPGRAYLIDQFETKLPIANSVAGLLVAISEAQDHLQFEGMMFSPVDSDDSRVDAIGDRRYRQAGYYFRIT